MEKFYKSCNINVLQGIVESPSAANRSTLSSSTSLGSCSSSSSQLFLYRPQTIVRSAFSKSHMLHSYEVCRFGGWLNPSLCPFSSVSSSLFSAHLLSILSVCQSYCHLFLPMPTKKGEQKRQKQLSVACCPFIIHFLLLE